MDKLEAMTTFVQVYRSRNFAAAATKQNVTPAVVTRRISALEQDLGARLFNRTTRKVQPTDIAVRYFEFCSRILSQIEAEEAEVNYRQTQPRGSLRISVPKAFGSLQVGQAAAAFIKRYPDIGISIVNDAPRDATKMLEDGIDLSIRMSRPRDSGMMARRVCKISWVVCASSAYLSSVPAIKRPQDLAVLNCLLHEGPVDEHFWHFISRKGRERVKVQGSMSSNSTLVLRGAVVDGLGVAMFPLYAVAAELAAGRLVQLLPGYKGPEHELFIVFPYRNHIPRKVRAFIDFFAERFKSLEWQARGIDLV